LRLIDVESNQPRGLALGSKQPPNGPETVQTPRETNKPSSEQTPLQQSQRCQFVHGSLNQAIFGLVYYERRELPIYCLPTG